MGVWIEIYVPLWALPKPASHSPWWECGLKLTTFRKKSRNCMSLPLVGVWIEMIDNRLHYEFNWCHSPWWECGLKSVIPEIKSPFWIGHSPWWECGLKSNILTNAINTERSLPLVGVWIEIVFHVANVHGTRVTPLGGSVDWNFWSSAAPFSLFVTPLGGSVDWNLALSWLAEPVIRHSPWWECGLKFP